MNKYFLTGLKESYPIVLGYIPIGLAFGVLASSASISPLGVLFISLILFAGSAQFITVSMIVAGLNSLNIIATIFVVNFRHFLMSSSYSRYFKNEKVLPLLFLSYFVTDESFAVGINKAKYDNENFNKDYLLGVELGGYLAWACFTTLGAYIGSFITDFEALGLDFALPAMFIGLLALLIKSKKDLLICVIAGFLTVSLSFTPLHSFSIIIGSIIASVLLLGGNNND